MKLVRCNKCEHEYYICDDLHRLGFPLGELSKCEYCGEKTYTVLESDIKVAYNNTKDDMDTQQEDIKHSLALFKEELDELVKTYIEPFLK